VSKEQHKTIKARFFSSAATLHDWLEKNHAHKAELWVGFYKKKSGKKGITYPEAVDEALCFGWIDGLKKSIDENSYTLRFTPRKAKSIWSVINTKRAKQLSRLGLMQPAGRAAFALRDPKRSGVYSFETAPREFIPLYKTMFRANKTAWEYFQHQPPGYQRLARYWVMSAKKEETRLRRLNQLINDSAESRRLGVITGQAAT
jgi:uncharacterized protein YdeI (YjbR/CyaY-like superfamily)